MFKRKGFVIIVVISFLAILTLIVWAVVNIGCSEILQTRINNDTVSARYAAASGAELMYAHLKSLQGQAVDWQLQSISGSIRIHGTTGLTVGRSEEYVVPARYI